MKKLVLVVVILLSSVFAFTSCDDTMEEVEQEIEFPSTDDDEVDDDLPGCNC